MELFLPGYIFMLLFLWLNSRKLDLTIIALWSMFISYIIQSIWSIIHQFTLSKIIISSELTIIIYIITAVVMCLVFTYIKNNSLILQKLLYKSHKTGNDDIFDDIIDYNLPTMMCVYMKSNILYIGKFSIKEEKGLDSWITLINYFSADKETKEKIFDPDEKNLKSVVVLNLRDIERIELIYEDESKVWNNLITHIE